LPDAATFVSFPGFLGQLFDAFCEPTVGFPHLVGKFANLSLCGTPQLTVLPAVFLELLRKIRGDVLDPAQPLLSGHHAMVSQTSLRFQNFFSSSTSAVSPFLR
jgi:hypothetical protein